MSILFWENKFPFGSDRRLNQSISQANGEGANLVSLPGEIAIIHNLHYGDPVESCNDDPEMQFGGIETEKTDQLATLRGSLMFLSMAHGETGNLLTSRDAHAEADVLRKWWQKGNMPRDESTATAGCLPDLIHKLTNVDGKFGFCVFAPDGDSDPGAYQDPDAGDTRDPCTSTTSFKLKYYQGTNGAQSMEAEVEAGGKRGSFSSFLVHSWASHLDLLPVVLPLRLVGKAFRAQVAAWTRYSPSRPCSYNMEAKILCFPQMKSPNTIEVNVIKVEKATQELTRTIEQRCRGEQFNKTIATRSAVVQRIIEEKAKEGKRRSSTRRRESRPSLRAQAGSVFNFSSSEDIDILQDNHDGVEDNFDSDDNSEDVCHEDDNDDDNDERRRMQTDDDSIDVAQNSAHMHNRSIVESAAFPSPHQHEATATTGLAFVPLVFDEEVVGSYLLPTCTGHGSIVGSDGRTEALQGQDQGKSLCSATRFEGRWSGVMIMKLLLLLAMGCCGCEEYHGNNGLGRGSVMTTKTIAHAVRDTAPSPCSIPVQEYEALHALYNATRGMDWAWRPPSEGAVWNFTSAGSMVDSLSAPCGNSWQGITCTHLGGGNCSITELLLQAYTLRGTIPSSIGQLTALEYLYLDTNSLTGPIPSSIEGLTALLQLMLYTNSLTGSIPPSIGQLTALEYLKLFSNSLTGTIPSSIVQLTGIVDLMLYGNSLTGSIPSSMGQLMALEYLNLQTNLLTGSIPSSIGQLTTLEVLDLYTNLLTASIPSSIGRLKALEYLIFYTNSLTGSIPSTIGQLTLLKYLYLNMNSLTGSMPSSIGQLTALEYLYLDTNSLTGSIPPSIGQLMHLEYLYLNANSLTGSLGDIKSLSLLGFLSLNGNMLDGSLAAWISSPQTFPLLYLLDLAQNAFTGTFPAVVFELHSLRILSASENCFSSLEAVSAVPGRARKSHLQTVQLNGLSSGASCIAHYFKATSLMPHPGYYPQVFLSQPIPSGLWSLPNMTSLYLEGNGFTGHIDVGNFSVESSVLTTVSLANNQLTGSIPRALQQYGKFIMLDLSYNMLSGGVSDNFAVPSVPGSTLSLAVNRLSGPLPSSLLVMDSNDLLSVVQGNIFTFDVTSRSQQTASLFNGSEQLDLSMIVSSLLVAIWLFLTIGKCSLRQLPLRITSDLSIWWDELLASEMLVGTHVGSSFEWGRFVTEIMNLLWVMMGLLCGAATLGAIYLVLKLTPSISSLFAVYTDQYSWTLSAAYMHNVAPLVMIMFVVFGGGVWFFTQVNLTPVGVSRQRHGIGCDGALKSGSAFVALSVGINCVVMLGINVGYVLAVIHNTPSLVLIQVAVGLFKSVWGTLYPRMTIMLSDWLKKRGLPSLHMNDDLMALHTYLLSQFVFNMVVAPCIATVLSDTACYYNVFVQQPSSVITTQVPCGDYVKELDGSTLEFGCGSPNASKTVPDDLSGTYYPPFIYSYQCGSALVTNYVPVLIYTFFFSGFVRPLLDIVVLLNSEWVSRCLPQWVLGMLFSSAYNLRHRDMKVDDGGARKINTFSHKVVDACGAQQREINPDQTSAEVEMHVRTSVPTSDPDSRKGSSPKRLLDAPAAVTRLVLHVMVMLTFGLAAPYLGVAVACSFLSEVAMLRLVLGRYLHLVTSKGRPIEEVPQSTFQPSSVYPKSDNAYQDEPLVEIAVSGDSRCIPRSSKSKTESSCDAALSSLSTSPPPALLHTPSATREYDRGRRRAEVMRELEWTVRGVWRYPSHSAGAVVVVTGLFWGLLSFDMIADVYGDEAGYAAMAMVMAGTPLVTYLGMRAALLARVAIMGAQLQLTQSNREHTKLGEELSPIPFETSTITIHHNVQAANVHGSEEHQECTGGQRRAHDGAMKSGGGGSLDLLLEMGV